MNYKNKYIKYKTKYLELKKMKVSNQNGGQCIKKILYENGNFFVENNIDNDKLDMNSTFLIGSITKIFTIYTILILHQNNLLNINDNIIKYVKIFNFTLKLKLNAIWPYHKLKLYFLTLCSDFISNI
jgi:hypothetical protein